MLKTGSYVCTCETLNRKGSAVSDLIIDCITSGVKSAAKQRQAFVWNKRSRHSDCKRQTVQRMTRYDGDGLSRSSDEAAERWWSEGLSLFGFKVNDKQQCDD